MRKSITSYEIYEDSTNYRGVAKVTLPTLTTSTVTVGGSGMGGKVEMPVFGHYEPMEMSMDFYMMDATSVALSTPKKHQIELRADRVLVDDITGEEAHQAEKHVMIAYPKTSAGGSIALADQQNGSGTYSVHYWAFYLDGVKQHEIDPVRRIAYIDGKDYLADERANLGLA